MYNHQFYWAKMK